MYEFDAIIGMDWLRKQWAKVDYYRKMIQFNPLNQPSFEFYSNQTNPSMALILVVEAHALLNKGC